MRWTPHERMPRLPLSKSAQRHSLFRVRILSAGEQGQTMRLRERIAKLLFGDLLQKEIAKATSQIVSHVEGSPNEDSVWAAKTLFDNLRKEEFQKSSKQVVSQIYGLSSSQGILPDIDFEIFNQIYEQTSWVRAVVSVISKAVTARGWTLVPSKPDRKSTRLNSSHQIISYAV